MSTTHGVGSVGAGRAETSGAGAADATALGPAPADVAGNGALTASDGAPDMKLGRPLAAAFP